MSVPFHQLSPEARIWIYQADRKPTEIEEQQILDSVQHFIDRWSTHGKKMLASATLLHDYFLVIGADETSIAASGCSIDQLVGFIKELGKRFRIDFLNREKIAEKRNGEIIFHDLPAFRQQIKDGVIGEDTRIFNNLVSTKKALDDSWIIPASQSWHRKYFN